jgi:glycosyltransferase involved in cell wall biosynthesis
MSEAIDLPRVLFCTSEIPQSINAGSLMLYRIMQSYPPDRVMVLGMIPEPGGELLACRYEPLRLLTHRLVCTRFHQWVTGLNSLNVCYEPGLKSSAIQIRDFDPDLIVTVMDKLSYYKHAWALSKRLGARLVTITLDDPQTFERAHPWLEGAYTRFLRRMYSDAVLSFGVSHEMCEYIEARFGKPSVVLYPPPGNIQPRAPAKSKQLRTPSRLTLGYAGSLSLGYREGILALLPSLQATGTTIVICTKDQHLLIEHPRIINRGFLSRAELWPTIQAECDAVILPYSFDNNIAHVYRTHFPSKLSEYCWSGMPIICSGPEYSTGVRWAKQHPQAAIVSTSSSTDTLVPLLRMLHDDGELRLLLATEGAKVAMAEFDAAGIRQRFVELLAAVAA